MITYSHILLQRCIIGFIIIYSLYTHYLPPLDNHRIINCIQFITININLKHINYVSYNILKYDGT